MAQETDDHDVEPGTVWLDRDATLAHKEYKAKLEEGQKTSLTPSQVVESACKTALEVEG